MSQEKQKGVAAFVAWGVGGIVLVLTLYVASIGPVTWIALGCYPEGANAPDWWLTLYDPVLRAARITDTTSRWLYHYLTWWSELGR
jgi:hypothetical protein